MREKSVSVSLLNIMKRSFTNMLYFYSWSVLLAVNPDTPCIKTSQSPLHLPGVQYTVLAQKSCFKLLQRLLVCLFLLDWI